MNEIIVQKDPKYGFELLFKNTARGWGVSFRGVDWNSPAQVDYVNEMTIPWPKEALTNDRATA